MINEPYKSILEWLNHDLFRTDVSWHTFTASSSVYCQWQLCIKESLPVKKAEMRWRKLQEQYIARSWIKTYRTELGRPRTLEFSSERQRLAQKKLEWVVWGRSDNYEQTLERIAGHPRPTSYRVITSLDNVWRDMSQIFPPDSLHGLTRKELGEVVHLSKRPMLNRFVRFLLQNGWKEKKVRYSVSSCRIIVKVHP